MIDVLAALDQAAGTFRHDLGHGDVVLGREIRRGRDHLAASHAAAKVRDLLGPLVDQEHDDVDVGVVDLDGMGHALQQRRLAGLGGRHDQAALAAADRRQEVGHASAHLVGIRLELEDRRGIDRDELLERRPLAESGWVHALHRFDSLQDRPAPLGDEPGDQGAGLEPFAIDQLAGHERVLGGRQIVGPRRDEDSGRVLLGGDVQDAFRRPFGPAGRHILHPLGSPPAAGLATAPAPAPAPAAAPAMRTRVAVAGHGAFRSGGGFSLNGDGREVFRVQGIFGHGLPNPAALTLGPGGNISHSTTKATEKRSRPSGPSEGPIGRCRRPSGGEQAQDAFGRGRLDPGQAEVLGGVLRRGNTD